MHAFGQRGVAAGMKPDPGDAGRPQPRGPDAHRDHGAPGIGQRRGGQQHKEIDEGVEAELHADRPAAGRQGIWHHGEEGHQARSQNIRNSSGRETPALPTLSWAQPISANRPSRGDVIDHIPMRIDDRQGHGDHRQRDPAGANGEQQAFALALRQRRLGKFLDVLPDAGPPVGQDAGKGENGRLSHCAHDTHSFTARSAPSMSPEAGFISSGRDRAPPRAVKNFVRRGVLGAAAAFAHTASKYVGEMRGHHGETDRLRAVAAVLASTLPSTCAAERHPLRRRWSSCRCGHARASPRIRADAGHRRQLLEQSFDLSDHHHRERFGDRDRSPDRRHRRFRQHVLHGVSGCKRVANGNSLHPGQRCPE